MRFSSSVLLILSIALWKAYSYPVIVQVDEETERCFSFNIPEDDDAHLLFVALPSEDEIEDEVVENFLVEQVYKMTKQKQAEEPLSKTFPDETPNEVAQAQSEYIKKVGTNVSKLKLVLQAPSGSELKYQTKYFVPTVLNFVKKLTKRGKKKRKDEEDLEGYSICLSNADTERQIQIVFDSILVSEEVEDEDGAEGFQKDKHLTPLERSLEQSIRAANSVLREMRYMEKREARMRMTAESINSRVRWFTYLSVAVLLSVTYVQVTYLKRYFHKKKLM